jgi:DNA replication protein DnaC
LSRLRLPAFREGLREQLGNPAVYAPLPFEERLTLLVEQECLRRESHRMKRLVHAARFPLQAEMEDLDLSASRGLDRKLVLELAQGRWIEQHTNLFLLGPTGCGKTYLACLYPARVRAGEEGLPQRDRGTVRAHLAPA